MRRFALLLLALGFCVVPAVSGAGPAPEGVLAKLETIYAARDMDAYRALLSPDYRFTSRTGESWDRDRDLAGTEKLFGTEGLTLAFTRNFTIHPGKHPNTWVLEEIPVELRVPTGDGVQTVETVVTLSVRRNPDTGFIQIFRWEEFAP